MNSFSYTSECRILKIVRASLVGGPDGESPSTRKQAWTRAAVGGFDPAAQPARPAEGEVGQVEFAGGHGRRLPVDRVDLAVAQQDVGR
jgi:hypothetical protein